MLTAPLINCEALETPVPVQIIEGTTFVPVRAIGEALDVIFRWKDFNQQVVMVFPDEAVLILTIGDKTVLGGTHGTTTLPAYPFLHPDGHTMVPVRLIFEQFGAVVIWEPVPFAQ